MTFNTEIELAEFINRNHYTFNGRHTGAGVGAGTPMTFDSLMRTFDYLKKEKAAKSANFNASIYVGGKTIPTIITVGIVDNGFSYSEKIVH